jgi:hypothetical protein
MGKFALLQLNFEDNSEMKPHTNCQRYVAVMEALTETGNFSAKDLREFNCCRIYLRVFYIFDISTFNGH